MNLGLNVTAGSFSPSMSLINSDFIITAGNNITLTVTPCDGFGNVIPVTSLNLTQIASSL